MPRIPTYASRPSDTVIRRLPPLLVGIALGALIAAQAGARTPAAAPPSAVDWLKKNVRAPTRTSYRAAETITVTVGGRVLRQRLRLVHRAPESTSWTYLSLQGKVERIVVDSQRSHWQYLPRRGQIIFSPSFPVDQELWQERYLGRLLENYTVRDAGKTLAAGRPARLLVVAPRSGHEGPTKRIWVDAATWITLKSILVSSDGRTTVASELSGLRVEKTIPAAEFAPPANAKKQTVIYERAAVLPLPALARQWRHPLLVPHDLPRGYSLESARLLSRGRRSFVHLRYFDGFNVVSLFEDVSSSKPPVSRSRRDDSIHGGPAVWHSYPPFHSLSWREQGLKLTLMGDLPRRNLLGIADGVRRVAR